MNPVNHKSRTDKAWSRLYNRLDRQGLLDTAQPEATGIFSGNIYLRWAASLLIVASVTFALYKGLQRDPAQMITLDNTETGSTLVKTLSDGSTVYLSSNSRLVYPHRFAKGSREVHLDGDAYFEVTTIKNTSFSVNTDIVSIKVLGTSFSVNTIEKPMPSLSVNTGLVEVTHNKTSESVNVSAGETVLIYPDNLTKVFTGDAEQFVKYSQRVHFKDETLFNVLSVISKGSQEVVYDISPDIAHRLVTATFSNNQPDSVVNLICLALNLKYKREGDTITIYKDQ